MFGCGIGVGVGHAPRSYVFRDNEHKGAGTNVAGIGEGETAWGGDSWGQTAGGRQLAGDSHCQEISCTQRRIRRQSWALERGRGRCGGLRAQRGPIGGRLTSS
jgi:hypothetical protein